MQQHAELPCRGNITALLEVQGHPFLGTEARGQVAKDHLLNDGCQEVALLLPDPLQVSQPILRLRLVGLVRRLEARHVEPRSQYAARRAGDEPEVRGKVRDFLLELRQAERGPVGRGDAPAADTNDHELGPLHATVIPPLEPGLEGLKIPHQGLGLLNPAAQFVRRDRQGGGGGIGVGLRLIALFAFQDIRHLRVLPGTGSGRLAGLVADRPDPRPARGTGLPGIIHRGLDGNAARPPWPAGLPSRTVPHGLSVEEPGRWKSAVAAGSTGLALLRATARLNTAIAAAPGSCFSASAKALRASSTRPALPSAIPRAIAAAAFESAASVTRASSVGLPAARPPGSPANQP